MNIIHRGVIALLQSAVTGEAVAIPEGFRLEDAAALIKKQNLTAMAYEGALRSGLPRNTPLMQQMFRSVCVQTLRSEKQLRAVEELFAAFDAAGFDYLPLKGCIMKGLYPNPALRPMGDADVLIRMEQYEAMKPVLTGLGYVPTKENDYELGWRSESLMVELHKSVIPPKAQDYYLYYKDSWQRAIHQAGGRYAYSPEDNFVYLFTHFVKHYRNSGIGARHLVDLWVYRRAMPELDEEKICGELRKLRLTEFYANILRTLEHWFEGGEGDDCTELITSFIFSGGTWGVMEYRVYSEEMRRGRERGYRGARFRRLLRTVFPPVRAMKTQYPVVERLPFLLPVFWVVRWMNVLINRPGRIRRQISDAAVASEENIRAYRESLNRVGLDFDFTEK